MVKTILLFRENADADRAQFTKYINDTVVSTLLPFCPVGLKTSVSDTPPPRLNLIPFRRDLAAVVSAKDASEDFVSRSADLPGFEGAYQVAEALPVSDEENWPKNTPAPGAGLLTLFQKKPGLSNEEFTTRWFEGHTPLTLKLHPISNYNRNHVQKTMEGALKLYDGIVEEHVKEARDLLNPLRFFGRPPLTLLHMLRVWWDVKGFIDYPGIETWLVTETMYRP